MSAKPKPPWWNPLTSFALFSPCERYRYFLSYPTGNADERIALGVFANPSTATAEQRDPTCTRWFNYCKAWGYGYAAVVNVRAWRETNPRLVPPDPDAIGPMNDHWIKQAASSADLVVCGWGKLGGERGKEVLKLIWAAGAEPHALKLNNDESPAHPLYLSGNLKPFKIWIHPDEKPRPPSGLSLDNAPIGTRAPAVGGGYWERTEHGWKWCRPGDTFPRPGGDWTGKLIVPEGGAQ